MRVSGSRRAKLCGSGRPSTSCRTHLVQVARCRAGSSGKVPAFEYWQLKPVVTHSYVTHPPGDTVICRFMGFDKFRDLFAKEELYLRRTDQSKGDDLWEVLLSDDYIRAKLGLPRYDPADELRLINEHAFLCQNWRPSQSEPNRYLHTGGPRPGKV
jgi:hypothetical protein